MILTIENTGFTNIFDCKKFGEYIKDLYRLDLISSVNRYNFTSIDMYLKTLNLKDLNNNSLDLKSKLIMLNSIKIIKVEVNNDTIYLKWNDNILFPNTNIPYSSLCKLVNDGNLNIQGCKIYDKLTKEILKNIVSYYKYFIDNIGEIE